MSDLLQIDPELMAQYLEKFEALEKSNAELLAALKKLRAAQQSWLVEEDLELLNAVRLASAAIANAEALSAADLQPIREAVQSKKGSS